MDVLGENEALQQFFNGQDVSGVLESAAVDTSILEQYLSNDIDPTFMLPESPPDSGSEPCSPPQIPDVCLGSNWSNEQISHETLALAQHQQKEGLSEHYGAPASLNHHHGRAMNHIKASPPILDQVVCDSPVKHISPTEGYIQASTPSIPPVHKAAQDSKHLPTVEASTSTVSTCLFPHAACLDSYMVPKLGLNAGTMVPESKKRRRSDSSVGSKDQCQWSDTVWTKPSILSLEDGTCEMPHYDGDAHGISPVMAYQMLTWDRYQPYQWSTLYSSTYQILPSPGYHVDTDKGFSYSTADEAFVCQKKNHFQVTVHIGMVGDPKYVETPAGPMPVEGFQVNVFGVKLEAQNHQITIEQSQSDRSKKHFLPVQVNLPGNKITKVTLGRLHFSETTANNMRKKGKPNPDQRYFLMVVGLYATVRGKSYMLVANISERIIVRASNPGQFENDSEVLWQKGQTPDSVVCQGRVGVNTDSPDEALVVCGNAKIMGTVMHPSDRRAKENIQEVDSTEQLKRIAKMRIVEYDYKPEFATKMGIDQVHETGIIAQEVRELLPTAVREVGDIPCSDGRTLHNFLMVDKEQIFMENVGAVKQLCKLTDNLEMRIQELEVWNSRLAKLKNLGSMRSKSATADKEKCTKSNKIPTSVPPKKTSPLKAGKKYVCEKYQYCLQHRIFQATIILLVTTMAFCAICITALYMLTLREDSDYGSSTSNSSVFPVHTTVETLTTAPTSPWPPDLDFSSVFYSKDIYCCHFSTASDHISVMTSPSVKTGSLHSLSDANQSPGDTTLWKNLRHFSDWTNTSINSILITQNQQVIDKYYIDQDNCGKGNYSYLIPISKHIPINMPVTLQMNTSELLVVRLCGYNLREECAILLDYSHSEFYTVPNTQGYVHEWPLPVSRHYRSSYHFRASVAGQADCATDPNYAEMLFTDYHFHFYRRCQ
ncbi:myelin regulatory factor-like protein isoform X2 [Salminus brasiliensis]|uniref:myelin regulatory factor-like protein isoform X2 n=1 Tax=Salminus brasiliensis TaxID=930266 RepID=UPI003B8349E8